jgi:predicted nucleotidyltransferase
VAEDAAEPAVTIASGRGQANAESIDRPRYIDAHRSRRTTLEAIRSYLARHEPELRQRGLRHLAVFGSVARGEDRPDSDVDIAIEDGRSFSLFKMEDMRLVRQDALGRPVDLGLVGSLRPAVRAAFELPRQADSSRFRRTDSEGISDRYR